VKRRLVTLAAAASLALCVATVALWVRSCFVCDYVASARYASFSAAGRLSLIYTRDDYFTMRGWHSQAPTLGVNRAGPLDPCWERAGFVHARSPSVGYAGIPHWFLVVLFGIVPALRFFTAIRSRRRHRAGHCSRCDYDLRATPDRCPECGAAPTQS
jgi:hypothetical protein